MAAFFTEHVGAIPTLLAILGVALVLFWTEWIPSDVVALGVMLSLVATGLLEPAQAFRGFGSDTVMMILGLLILTAALTRTGVVDMAGRAILRQTGEDTSRLLAIVMVSTAFLSAFISNTAATAFFLPTVVGVARRARVSPARLLMPLAFSSILTSSVTVISTSTNIVVSGLMTEAGMAPMRMFELAPVGVPIAIAGITYMFFVGRRMIPDRATPADTDADFGLRPYLTEVLVQPGSRLIGKTLAESGLSSELDLTVLRVVRGKDRQIAPGGALRLAESDVLLVEATAEELLKIKDVAGIDIRADHELADPEIQSDEVKLAEVVLMPRSPLLGQTLKRAQFRERYRLQVLAINRSGELVRRKISEIPLRLGDILLVQGNRDALRILQEDDTFRLIGSVAERRPNVRKAPLTIAIFVASMIAATFGIVPLPVAVLGGAFLVFALRCITPEEAYREVEWKALVLIGSMLALGVAMTETGTAEYLAAGIVGAIGDAGPLWVLSGFFVLTVLLTQPMSNQAAAVVVFPVAVQTAVSMGLNPRTFAMMIAVAASCSYLTPLEPSCLMVYAPGRYRFFDFVKVGSLLTVLIFVIAIVLVPIVWPLR